MARYLTSVKKEIHRHAKQLAGKQKKEKKKIHFLLRAPRDTANPGACVTFDSGCEQTIQFVFVRTAKAAKD